MTFDIEKEIKRETARWKERHMSRSLADEREPDYRMQEELEQERRHILETILSKAFHAKTKDGKLLFTADEMSEMKREFGL